MTGLIEVQLRRTLDTALEFARDITKMTLQYWHMDKLIRLQECMQKETSFDEVRRPKKKKKKKLNERGL